jgi:hypothetical protein
MTEEAAAGLDIVSHPRLPRETWMELRRITDAALSSPASQPQRGGGGERNKTAATEPSRRRAHCATPNRSRRRGVRTAGAVADRNHSNTYNAVHHILTNPVYAGAYVFGRTKTVTRIEQGRKQSVSGKRLAQEQWQILITQHHGGYIGWDEYQANQRQITHNAAMKGRLVRGPARNGEALLAGLLRCGHCGRKLHVAYSGIGSRCRRYSCQGAMINHGIPDRCIAFGGFKADRVIEEELLRRLQPLGVHAALEAIDRQIQSDGEINGFRQRSVILQLQEMPRPVVRTRRLAGAACLRERS